MCCAKYRCNVLLTFNEYQKNLSGSQIDLLYILLQFVNKVVIRPGIVQKICISKAMNIFLSVYIKKRRCSGVKLRIFYVCNQVKR